MRAVVRTADGDFGRLAELLERCGVGLEAVGPDDQPGPVDLMVLDRPPPVPATAVLVETARGAGARVIALVDDLRPDTVAGLYRAGADVVFDAGIDHRHLFYQCCALLGVLRPEARGIRVGRALFDAPARRLHLDDHSVRLTEAESKILTMLVDGRSAYVARDAISETVFRIPYDRFDRRIDVHVSNLRKKLRENDVGALIDTSRLNGFRLLSMAVTDAATVS
jgi:DNA-binding response OmpR family regulator